MKKIIDVASVAGAMLFIIGLAGMGSACEGQGSFVISAIVFSVGFGMSFATFRKGEAR